MAHRGVAGEVGRSAATTHRRAGAGGGAARGVPAESYVGAGEGEGEGVRG